MDPERRCQYARVLGAVGRRRKKKTRVHRARTDKRGRGSLRWDNILIQRSRIAGHNQHHMGRLRGLREQEGNQRTNEHGQGVGGPRAYWGAKKGRRERCGCVTAAAKGKRAGAEPHDVCRKESRLDKRQTAVVHENQAKKHRVTKKRRLERDVATAQTSSLDCNTHATFRRA